MLTQVRTTWNEYPRQFWTLFFGALINSTGGGLVFPFFSLYLTRQLDFTMTDVGIIFGAYAVVSMVSQVVGGALVDRIGRKPVMMFSLFGSAMAIMVMGMTGTVATTTGSARLVFVAVVVVLLGLTGAIFGPAVNAMVADLVGGPKRSQAYGLLRVVQNLGIAIGPAIGGFIATRSYLVLFTVAAIASVGYGVIIALMARETRPQAAAIPAASAAVAPQDKGFWQVLNDQTFMVFCGLYLISMTVYSQMNTTLPVYLNKSFGVSEQWYGLLMSLNAAMVVLFQFPITRLTDRFARATMMALGMAFYAVGFGMFGFVGALPLFFLAQAIWTVGEMITVPVSQAFVADIAPETMRGRYMGMFGLTWVMAYGAGPLLGGTVMDRLGGQFIWYAAIALNLVAMMGFLAMGRRIKRPGAQPAAWKDIPVAASAEAE